LREKEKEQEESLPEENKEEKEISIILLCHVDKNG